MRACFRTMVISRFLLRFKRRKRNLFPNVLFIFLFYFTFLVLLRMRNIHPFHMLNFTSTSKALPLQVKNIGLHMLIEIWNNLCFWRNKSTRVTIRQVYGMPSYFRFIASFTQFLGKANQEFLLSKLNQELFCLYMTYY